MDTSELYIKMCEKAWEIQEEWKPAHADWYYGIESGHNSWEEREHYEVCLLADFDSEGAHFHLEPEHINKDYAVRLPRQDQLQEMLNTNDLTELLQGFYCFCGAGDGGYVYLEEDEYASQFTSMEQLWFAFVMKENYNKVWDGKDWTSG